MAPQSNGPYHLDYIPSTSKNIYLNSNSGAAVVSQFDQNGMISPPQSQQYTGNFNNI